MINRVILVGRLTRDPELKYTTNNIANLRFTVAVNRRFTNQNGERQADFIDCVAWRNQAENMARFLKKGALIGVEGRIETGSYQAQDGQMRYTTDVVADNVQFLEPRSAQGSGTQPGFGGNDNFNQFPSGAGQHNQFPPGDNRGFSSGSDSGNTNSFPSSSGNNSEINRPFPSSSGNNNSGSSNPFPSSSGNSSGSSNPFPSGDNSGSSNPFPSENNSGSSNPFPSNADNNNVPEFNSTIDISDDDLPF